MKKYVLFIALAGLQIAQAYVRPRGLWNQARQIINRRNVEVLMGQIQRQQAALARRREQQRLLEQQRSYRRTQQANADVRAAREFLRRRQQSYRSSGNPVFRLLSRLFG